MELNHSSTIFFVREIIYHDGDDSCQPGLCSGDTEQWFRCQKPLGQGNGFLRNGYVSRPWKMTTNQLHHCTSAIRIRTPHRYYNKLAANS